MKPFDASRRSLLIRAGALGAIGASPFALNLAGFGAAARATGSNYKALVCIFMAGGDDSFNLLLPTDAASWANYTTARNTGTAPINLLAPGTAPNSSASAGSPAALGGALAISPTNPQGRTFATHPSMVKAQSLFASGKLAWVANAGPLNQPTTKAQYAAGTNLPIKLYSHNDQQSTWQSFSPEGSTAGWGGRMGDLLASGNGANSNFTAVSAAGSSVFLAGASVVPYMVGKAGPSRIGGNGATTLFGSTKAFGDMQSIVSSARTTRALELDVAAASSRSISAESELTSSLPASTAAPFGSSASPDPTLQYISPVTGKAANSGLAKQLQVIARMISAGQSLGLTRQVFYASFGSFDTHDNQGPVQAEALACLDQALSYFDATITSMGLSNSVTTFTMSDFGRTFTSNGDGTDHGWGSHHMVMGGAVKGGDIYGTFPQFGVSDGKGGFTSPDQIQNGILIPTTSTDQYAATLGSWFGVGSSDLATICPHLGNFNTKNLGFV